MKQFATALILSSVTAVSVKKAYHNPAYDEPQYTVVEEVATHYPAEVEEVEHVSHVVSDPYYTDLQDDPHYEDAYVDPYAFRPAPRYWDDHLHYEGPTQVNFSSPEPFAAAPVDWRLPAFLPYIPKFKNNHVDV